MRMSDPDIRQYPRLAYYVRVNIPEVINVPSIVTAITTYGQLTTTQLLTALRWRHGPSIVIVPGLICGGGAAYGCFRHANPGQVEIKAEWVSELEAGRGLTVTSRGGRVYLIGVKLLHELVHWGDYRDSTVDGVTGGGEAGNAFERDVYGGVVHA